MQMCDSSTRLRHIEATSAFLPNAKLILMHEIPNKQTKKQCCNVQLDKILYVKQATHDTISIYNMNIYIYI